MMAKVVVAVVWVVVVGTEAVVDMDMNGKMDLEHLHCLVRIYRVVVIACADGFHQH